MTTRAELAFNILDTDNTGYITLRQLKMISKKLSSNDVKALMIKVFGTLYEISRVFKLTSSLYFRRPSASPSVAPEHPLGDRVWRLSQDLSTGHPSSFQDSVLEIQKLELKKRSPMYHGLQGN